MATSSEILFYVNGSRRTVSSEALLSTLLSYLRYTERLTGTKLGCGEGGCGACTVLLSTFDRINGKVVHRAVNACLVPLAAVDGGAITTIEAVGDRRGGLAPVQTALVNMHGSQCGFCTPGIVMSMFALLRQRAVEGKAVSERDVEGNFDGNLCRCTGYRPILDAFKGLVRKDHPSSKDLCAMGDQCCRKIKETTENGKLSGSTPVPTENGMNGEVDKNSVADLVPVDREYIFPPELVTYSLCELNTACGRWLRPVSLERLIQLRIENPKATLIVGNTELGVEAKFKGLKVDKYLCVSNIPELSQITEVERGLRIGSSVTWTQLWEYTDKVTALSSTEKSTSYAHKYRSLLAIKSQLKWFAGKQIRNMAVVGGNIVTASPISDINPIWMAARAGFVLLDCRTKEERTIPARDFFLSYRKVDIKKDEILFYIHLPWNESLEFIHSFKTSRRREDDIAIVSAGVRIRLGVEKLGLSTSQTATSGDLISHEGHVRISDISIAFGGLAPRTIAMIETERILKGMVFNEVTLQKGLSTLAESTILPKDVPGGMPEYRQSLALSFLFKAFVYTARGLDEYCMKNNVSSAPFAVNAIGLKGDKDIFLSTHADELSCGVQIVSELSPESRSDYTGKSVKHVSGVLQVSGEATYLDDIPPFHGELQAYPILSTEAHAKILSIDLQNASQMAGVRHIITSKDVRGSNLFGPVFKDEFCFAEDSVTVLGQIIGLVLADSVEHAKDAAKAVNVSYEKLPAIITIEDAISASSYAAGVPEHCIRIGNADEIINKAAAEGKVVEGTVRIGAQEHWYLETNGTIAVPEENGEMMILSSTQNASDTQRLVSEALDEPMHKIRCKVKRLGGGFGGKETRSIFISVAVAVAAQASQSPVRLILDRDVDMLTTGTRHAFLANYKASYESTGKISALQMEMFLNMGNTVDLSIAVLDRALYHITNSYDISDLNVVGKACYTNSASATAFRGFGAPQGMMMIEHVVEHVSHEAKVPVTTVRDLNLYGKHGNGSVTTTGMKFNHQPLVSCWDKVLCDSDFQSRRASVDLFNSMNKYRKRGLAALPTMYGISFTLQILNQAGALVHIYHGDGSVLISHGGVEMGQGLHTKICQIAATTLGLPIEKIFISETATDKVPNAVPTAASFSSDLYGIAVINACQQLLENLKPSREELGATASWEQVVSHAWCNRIPLSATGFCKTPEIDQVNLDVPGATGRPFLYFTNGAAVSEVEIDTLTGENRVLRTDIVMDIGRPLNPSIDVGQIEGGFVQGLGWCTIEEVVRGSKNANCWVKEGDVFTLGPGTYKIPGFADVPADFRVTVLNTRNEKYSVHSSKAVGEPPLFLAASAFFALRDAVYASRLERGWESWFEFDSPATVERVRMAAGTKLSDSVPGNENFRAQLSL